MRNKVRLILGTLYLGIIAVALVAVNEMMIDDQGQGPHDTAFFMALLHPIPLCITELITYGYIIRFSDIWIAAFLLTVACQWWPLPALICLPTLWKRHFMRYIISGYLFAVILVNALASTLFLLGLLYLFRPD